jgi:hypothetical protein
MPSKAFLTRRLTANPPSTKLTHSKKKVIIWISWFVGGAAFRRLVSVTALLLATHQFVSIREAADLTKRKALVVATFFILDPIVRTSEGRTHP